VHLCFWRLFPRPPPRPPPCPPLPRPGFPSREDRAAPVDASLMSLVMVIRSAYLGIASIHCWALGAEIRYSRIWMIISYQLVRVVKICVLLASWVILSVVPISFLRKAIWLVKYCVTVSSGDGQEVVNFRRTWVRPSFVEALSSRSLSASSAKVQIDYRLRYAQLIASFPWTPV
jgi:hypothetical protein